MNNSTIKQPVTVTLLCTAMLFELFISLYVIKSAMGINLFESQSLGLWTWINQSITAIT